MQVPNRYKKKNKGAPIMAATIWYEKDADLSVFDGKKVAILGYGSQGHAHALNLRDSGVDVVVGLRPTSKSVEYAKEQGLEVKPVAEAVAEADVVMILLPDQYQAAVYKEDVEPNLKPGAALAFAHGFNIHYGYIKPSEDHPVFMVAPKGPGHIVRREYAAGRGVPVVVAVEQDPDGKTWPLCLAYAKALGALRAGAIKTTFTEETETDLFGEQDVLMGGINHLCDMGFDVLTEAGYQPEIAYFEVFHELKMLVDLANEGGLNKARWSCSDTAQYGDYTSTVITEETKKRMQYQLKRIQDGSFAKEFMDDQAAGAPKFKELQEEYSHPHLETVGPKLRAMFSWNNQTDADADMAESFNGKIARTQVQ
jgi:ketol-acid reductoisomerase